MAIQETHPGLLTMTETTIEDRIRDFARDPRTRVRVLGEQHHLFSEQTTPMVELRRGSDFLTVARDVAAKYGLSPR